MTPHPLCRILPEMPDAEFRPLVADIRAKGLMRPITVFEGMILDGRHRFKACIEAGIEPRFEQYTGTDPVGFVQSCCTHRSLNPTQRAMVAAGFLEYEREQARKRQIESGEQFGRGKVPVNSPGPIEKGEARDRAGARMGVSGSTVTVAARVIEKAVPEIVEKCKTGDMALNEAKRVVNLRPDAQKRIAALPKQERGKAIETAEARSFGRKARDHKRPVVELAGTPFVRTLLSGIERLAMFAAEGGLKSSADIASKFMDEMDWNSVPLQAQLERCEPVIRALAMIQQQARKAA